MKQLIPIFAFTCTLFATPVTVTLISANGPIQNGDVIGPYVLQIGTQDYTALCFDLFDESFVGETWQANLDALNGVTYFTNQPDFLEKYQEEIALFNLIVAPGISQQDQVAIQDAAWGLFDSLAPTSPLSLYYQDQASAAVAQGIPNIQNYRFVESPGNASDRAQAFVIDPPPSDVPDVPAYASAGFGLIFVGLLAYRRRG